MPYIHVCEAPLVADGISNKVVFFGLPDDSLYVVMIFFRWGSQSRGVRNSLRYSGKRVQVQNRFRQGRHRVDRKRGIGHRTRIRYKLVITVVLMYSLNPIDFLTQGMVRKRVKNPPRATKPRKMEMSSPKKTTEQRVYSITVLSQESLQEKSWLDDSHWKSWLDHSTRL